jgi:galactokinase
LVKFDLGDTLINIYGESDQEVRFFSAPGRVNLIGEHIDFNGGYVFPAAIDKASTVAIRKRKDDIIKLYACDLKYIVEADMKKLDEYRSLKWGNYQLGVVQQLLNEGFNIHGCELIFNDLVPFGSGLSSSAAIEVVTAYAISSIYGYEPDKIRIAKLAQKAEHEYIGVNCGIMDQFTSAMGKKDNAILLNCDTLEYEYVPIVMDGYSLVISNTNKKHSLGSSMYNKRRSECEKALENMKKQFPDKNYLCDFSYAQFLECEDTIECMDCRKRAEHAVCENERVKDSVIALKKGDLAAFGKYMNGSHISLRDLYEVSCIELDTLVESAWHQKGVLGSRMTGAGFGGCTVSVVKNEHIHDFINNVGKAYLKTIGFEASFYICSVSDGVKEI